MSNNRTLNDSLTNYIRDKRNEQNLFAVSGIVTNISGELIPSLSGEIDDLWDETERLEDEKVNIGASLTDNFATFMEAGGLTASIVTKDELSYLTGAESNIQDQLDDIVADVIPSGVLVSVSGANHIGHHDSPEGTHTVADMFKHISPHWLIDGGIITAISGLNISWTAGSVICPLSLEVMQFDSGSGTLTDDAENFLYYECDNEELQISTTENSADEVRIGTFNCAGGDIWRVHQEINAADAITDTLRGLSQMMPAIITNGLIVSEDTDATNDFDVVQSAGEGYARAHEYISTEEIKSRNTNLLRWHKDGVGPEYTYDTNAEIDITQFDDDGTLTAIPAGRWARSVFFTDGTRIHWVYPTTHYAFSFFALLAADPPLPPGLEAFPKTSALIYQEGDTALPTAGSDQWIDVRPQLGVAGTGTTISDHGELSGLTDDDHTQYLLIDGTREMTGDLGLGNNNIEFTGALNAVDMQYSSGSGNATLQIKNTTGNEANVTIQNNLTVGDDLTVDNITVTGNVDGVDVSAHAANTDAHHAESHTVASHSDTSATGAELNTLTDGSTTTLHRHATWVPLQFGQRDQRTSSDYYDCAGLISGLANAKEYIMPASGSIVAITWTWNWEVHTTDGTMDTEVFIAGVKASLIGEESLTSGGGTGVKSGYVTQAEGVDTFSAGDGIIPYSRYTDGLAGQWDDAVCTVWVVLD